MKDLNVLRIAQRMVLLKQTEEILTGTDGSSQLRKQLLDRVASWYLFPGTQARPRVVGIWGMTGTGKTHFVRELVRQLCLEDQTNYLPDTRETRIFEPVNMASTIWRASPLLLASTVMLYVWLMPRV